MESHLTEEMLFPFVPRVSHCSYQEGHSVTIACELLIKFWFLCVHVQVTACGLKSLTSVSIISAFTCLNGTCVVWLNVMLLNIPFVIVQCCA